MAVVIGDDFDNAYGGTADKDTIYGGLGNDSLSGGEQNDDIYGGDGNDMLIGATGAILSLAAQAMTTSRSWMLSLPTLTAVMGTT
jgi:hypothetical protein